MVTVPYANVIGSLMYDMVCLWPNIAHTVSVFGKSMTNLGREHWNGVKWLLMYITESMNVDLKLGSSNTNVIITRCVDSVQVI